MDTGVSISFEASGCWWVKEIIVYHNLSSFIIIYHHHHHHHHLDHTQTNQIPAPTPPFPPAFPGANSRKSLDLCCHPGISRCHYSTLVKALSQVFWEMKNAGKCEDFLYFPYCLEGSNNRKGIGTLLVGHFPSMFRFLVWKIQWLPDFSGGNSLTLIQTLINSSSPQLNIQAQ